MKNTDIINYLQMLRIEIKQNTFCGKSINTMVEIEDIRWQDDKIVLVPKQDLFRMELDDGR
jgi:hypothetical protein